MYKFSDAIDTENWKLLIPRTKQHDDFAASIPGYTQNPNDFWIHEYADKKWIGVVPEETGLIYCNHAMTVVPSGTDGSLFDTAVKARENGFILASIHWLQPLSFVPNEIETTE